MIGAVMYCYNRVLASDDFYSLNNHDAGPGSRAKGGWGRKTWRTFSKVFRGFVGVGHLRSAKGPMDEREVAMLAFHKMRRFVAFHSIVVALALAAFATSGWAESTNIDTDVHLDSPVPHRYIHGTLDDAKFQIALPDDWNGKLLIGARGFSGDELSSGAFKTVGLQKGFAYALSDQGWNRYTIVDIPQDKYYESRRRILQLTNYVKAYVKRYYGEAAWRTYMVGGSNGGHNTKWMVEDYPAVYDGGLAGYGITSYLEWMGSITRFLRNYDIFGSRIDDIIAARTANQNWNPVTDALSPPLTSDQIQALLNIYTMPAQMASGLTFNVGRFPGSEYRWPGNYAALLGYAQTSLQKFDRTYDPNGDGVLSLDEIKAWDPHLSPIQIQNDLRKMDLDGNLHRPLIMSHGTHDPIVSIGESYVYKRMVEENFGVAGARDVLAVYYIPGMGHGGAEFNAIISPALDALDAWVDYRETHGSSGSLPPDVLGGYPRD